MKKIGLVIKREYLRRVNKKSFFLVTILMPFLFAALVFVPLWLSSIKDDNVREVMILDKTGKYATLFRDTDSFKFINAGDNASLEAQKGKSNGIFAFLEISDDLLDNPKAVALYSEKQIPQDLRQEVNRTLSRFLEDEKRKSFNIPNIDEIIEKSRVNISAQTIKWGKDGEAKETSAEMGGFIGMLFTLIIYIFIMMYGAMVMQGVMEEKTNRIVEVMVSSVRPFDLMMGKIIGIGLVGLTQIVIWVVLTSVLVSVGGIFFGLQAAATQPDMAMMQQNMPEMQNMTANILTKLGSFNFVEIVSYFVLFFIGGYISYASLYAAIGAAIDNPEDSQQFMTPMIMLLIFAMYAGIYSMNNPDGPLAFWCSLIPFTSPIVMMIRIPYEIPFWQILLSLALLYASAVALVWMSAKIYRVGILMYGKKPSLKEIAKWVRY
ncbi:MAG: ABC transporter permease [Tannerella sp.]|jgi:ABC-2 type transport system permease protein|nr:ABC transporter permease [Tannerella sp.]